MVSNTPCHWYKLATKLFTSIGLVPCLNDPWLFSGSITGGSNKVYDGLYVDVFIYFGGSDAVERHFEYFLRSNTLVTFTPNPYLFLGIKILRCSLPNNKFSIHLSQEVIVQNLMTEYNLSNASTNPTPYRSGYPVDKIPINPNIPHTELRQAENVLRSLVGSFNRLARTTRPDILTITNILDRYLHHTFFGYIAAAKYVLKYLIGISDLWIEFSPIPRGNTEAVIKFPPPPDTTISLCDSNWGRLNI